MNMEINFVLFCIFCCPTLKPEFRERVRNAGGEVSPFVEMVNLLSLGLGAWDGGHSEVRERCDWASLRRFFRATLGWAPRV